MPATTPERGYPYPLDPDPIDVAGDIEKLAMSIDDDVDDAHVLLEGVGGRVTNVENNLSYLTNVVLGVRSVYIKGVTVGPTIDNFVWPIWQYTVQKTGICLINANHGVFVDSGPATIDVVLDLSGSWQRIDRKDYAPSNQVATHKINEALRVFAGQTIGAFITKVEGTGRYMITDTTGQFNGATLLEGVASQWV